MKGIDLQNKNRSVSEFKDNKLSLNKNYNLKVISL